MIKAGVSIVDISPEKGVQLAGYPHCPRPNTGIHDPLYASCIYLNNGVDDVVIVAMDCLYIGKKYVKQLRERFDKKIIISASHTHSGPWAAEPLAAEMAQGIKINEAYVSVLMEKLEHLISEAIENTFAACISSGIGQCTDAQGVGGNRRKKGGPSDPSVNVLAVKDMAGKVRACHVSYALHPTFLHAQSTLVTADYPCYIRRFLSFAYPEAVLLFAQGAAGDQSSRYHRVGQSFDEAARVGTTIGIEVMRSIEKMSFLSEADISYKAKEVELELREFPAIDKAQADLEAARAHFDASRNADYLTARNAELALFGAENILTYSNLAQQGYHSGELPCEVGVLTLGDMKAVTVQGELFVEFALKIKQMKPEEKIFVLTTTNGALPGYIYTRQAYMEGGYEVGTSMLAPGAGENIVDTVKQIIA